MQVFGKDSFLNLGQNETKESRDAWVADVDMDVSHPPRVWPTSGW